MGKDDRYDFDGAEDELGNDDGGEVSDMQPSTGSDVRETDVKNEVREWEPGGDSVPHRVRYDSPKEGRRPKTLYFDQDDVSRIRELKSVAEGEFDETVYDLDVYLAAFRSDLSEASFLAEMRSIGYGYFE